MKQLHVIILLSLISLQSCKMTYQRVQFEKFYENNTLITKEKKLKSIGNSCHSKEITTRKDTILSRVIFKEIVTRDCRGAYSYVIKRTIKRLVKGKKATTVSSE